MWCFACCCFPQHRSSAHQDPWFFQHLRYSNVSKFSTLSSYRIRGTTCFEIARHLSSVGLPRMVCAFVCEKSVYGIILSGDFSTKHDFILFTLSCLREMTFRMLRFSSTVSRLVARNAWNFWCENYSLSDQIRRRTACIFRHELS